MDQTITLELTLDEVQRLIAALHELIDTEQGGDDNAIEEQDKALLMKLVEVIR